jgi:tetratricopeptide (TPR) repeat protein
MGIVVSEVDKRRIVPRWRSLEVAQVTGELSILGKASTPLPFHSKTFIDEQIKAWTNNRDIRHAGDLLSAAYVLGLEDEFHDVARFLVDSEVDQNSAIRKVAGNIIHPKKNEIELFANEITKVNDVLDHSKYHGEIARYRSYLKNEPRNPIAWIELGRLYSMVNLSLKGEKCVQRALSLNKDNRFIVRSASRFYHHTFPLEDKALHVVKNSKFLKDDPWLISAEIAYSTILERHSKLTKFGVDFVKLNNQDYFSTTELNSALGTVELNDGSIRQAKKYFSTSLIRPNDNSIAQASWIAKDVSGININLAKYNLPLAFEAEAQISFTEKKYVDAFNHAVNWLADEPFSSRPIKFASSIASIYLDDPAKGMDLLRIGLNINPDDPHLNNNLIYYLAKDDQVDEATHLFESKLRQHIDGDIEVNPYVVIATAGLLCFRRGLPEEGRKYYARAIELIKQRPNKDYLLALANLNLIEEEIRYANSQEDLTRLLQMAEAQAKKITDHDEINFFFKKVANKINLAIKEEKI